MILMPDLFSFAYVPNWYSQLDMLAEMALPEPWRFKNPIYLTKNPDMGNRAAVRRLVDLLMTVALVLLMAYFLTDQEIHEWLGAGMLVLFIIHHILNFKWLKALNRGKYTPCRILQTALALLVLLCMLGSMLSGIWMSRYVFDFLPTQGHMGLARMAHLCCAYWGFILLSAHLGLHWGMVLGAARQAAGNKKPSARCTAVLRVLSCGISAYGVYVFLRHHIADYLFLRSHFVFFDYEQPPVLYFLDLLAMMGLWIALPYYLGKALRNRAGRTSHQSQIWEEDIP